MRTKSLVVFVALVVGLGLLACQQATQESGTEQPQATQRAARTAPKPAPVSLPAGTELRVSLLDRLSSDDNQTGDKFSGTLEEPIVLNSKQVVPKYAKVQGKIDKAVKSGRLKQRAELWVTLTALEVGGKSYTISTSTAGEKEGSKTKRDVILIGGGAGAGAAIGGATGGGKGAGIGAAIGAGAGTAAAALTGKRDIVYPPETVVLFRLSDPVTLR